ncbi:MAG: biopolymer transporter ExbB [Alphaproteobacteria bacterium]|nr:biopolymer transporter ExbB [Alphaproteobacteria bacterium]
MLKPDTQNAEPQFSQPIRQILTMTVLAGLVGTGAWISYVPFFEIVSANPYLNGFILMVFGIGVFSCFWQVFGLMFSVSWIKGFALDRVGHEFVGAPRLLTSLATLLKSRRAHTQLSASSSRSLLDTLATRLDESREITRYIISLLIFLGLLGTFYGLATTVPAVVDTIRSLAPTEGEDPGLVFGRLMTGLEKQLGGMGTAFSSSLLGLAGSLVVGLLDLFSGNSQNRFYRELEEWLSTMTQVGYSAGDGEGGGVSYDTSASDVAFHRMAESVEALHQTFIQGEATQAETGERLAGLSAALTSLGERLGGGQPDKAMQQAIAEQNALLMRIADGQEAIAAAMLKEDEDVEEAPVDAESRMRLRSIDVQLLRILEEMSAGRQDTVAELRADIAALTKAVRSQSRKPPVQPQAAPNRGR